MAQPNLSFRPHTAPRDFRYVMVGANIALNNGQLTDALDLYTEVLYKLSPGHVCAFLNRSMVFLRSGRRELAVMDAYRAYIAAAELRKVCPAIAILLLPDLNIRYKNGPSPHISLEC